MSRRHAIAQHPALVLTSALVAYVAMFWRVIA